MISEPYVVPSGEGMSCRYLVRIQGRYGRDLLLELGIGSETSGIFPWDGIRDGRMGNRSPGFGVRVTRLQSETRRERDAQTTRARPTAQAVARRAPVHRVQQERKKDVHAVHRQVHDLSHGFVWHGGGAAPAGRSPLTSSPWAITPTWRFHSGLLGAQESAASSPTSLASSRPGGALNRSPQNGSSSASPRKSGEMKFLQVQGEACTKWFRKSRTTFVGSRTLA